MYDMAAAEFEGLVGDVLAALPPALSQQIANVAFGVEDGVENPDLLGLYRGISLDRRVEYAFALPDTITIYRLPILARCRTRDEVLRQVEITVKHEIGHYFGIDDGRLHELGYG